MVLDGARKRKAIGEHFIWIAPNRLSIDAQIINKLSDETVDSQQCYNEV